MVKIYFEKEVGTGDEKKIEKVKEVADIAEAVASKKAGEKNFYHLCYHEDEVVRPCKRVEIK